jgi:hypothetical protein
MNRTRLVVAAVATIALLASAGAAAAAPGQADSANGEQGPPSDLPGPVPDFVGDVHDAITDFLAGGIDALGEAVSGVTPGGPPEGAGSAADS